ncbi:hypothetical protein R3I93_010024 [Phoxinus phoxinus]|uniref:Uncharacterized protein n=1 Tax=Phoxinus phoxinus TaxID=58324 RepID=A0AAN9CZ58_9TELE
MQQLSVSHCCFNYFQYCLPSSPDHRVQPQLSRPEQLIQDHQNSAELWSGHHQCYAGEKTARLKHSKWKLLSWLNNPGLGEWKEQNQKIRDQGEIYWCP